MFHLNSHYLIYPKLYSQLKYEGISTEFNRKDSFYKCKITHACDKKNPPGANLQ